MRFFRDNRYVYRVVKAVKRSRVFLRPLILCGGILDYLLHHTVNRWDYIDGIIGNGYIYELRNFRGVKFYLPYLDEDAIQKIIVRDEDFYERDTLNSIKEKYIRDNMTFLDIGANIGNHTAFFSRVCNAKKIYSFEPIKDTYDILQENVRINHLNKVVSTYNFGVGDGKKKARIHSYDPNNIGATSLEGDPDGDVDFFSIDSMGIQDVDFIKIDVEKMEDEVLLGARETILEYKPVIMIEVDPENVKNVGKIMDEMGYKMRESYGRNNYVYCV